MGTFMKLDLSNVRISNRGFSEQPMRFVDPEPKKFLSDIIDLIALETGNRKAREYWQRRQLQNLLKHASMHSQFWRKRIGSRKANDIQLSDLPVLTRSDVVEQVAREGSLLASNAGLRVKRHLTSGSSGTPVEFFISEMNGSYNEIRSVAQYFMEGRPLQENSTRLSFSPGSISSKSMVDGFSVARNNSWCLPLSSLCQIGKYKDIEYSRPKFDLLLRELQKESIGYLVAAPWTIETVTQYIDLDDLKGAGLKMWIAVSESPSRQMRNKFLSSQIPVRANYSSEEVGLIGWECNSIPLSYHVATSNVIAEISNDEKLKMGNDEIGRVLITHLHSYATPFVRYDIGDLATLSETCACGHDGPTLSNLYGRKKSLLKHADGRVSPFYLDLDEIKAREKIVEYRITQTDSNRLFVELVGKADISADDISSFQQQIGNIAGDEFAVEVKVLAGIDWGRSAKRLGFRNEIL